MANALQAKITDALSANSGRVLWTDFVVGLDSKEKHVLHDTLRDTKRLGIAKRSLERDEQGNQTLYIVSMSNEGGA
jgi:hypothetical protein